MPRGLRNLAQYTYLHKARIRAGLQRVGKLTTDVDNDPTQSTTDPSSSSREVASPSKLTPRTDVVEPACATARA